MKYLDLIRQQKEVKMRNMMISNINVEHLD